MSRSQNITGQITPTLANDGVTIVFDNTVDGQSTIPRADTVSGAIYCTTQNVTLRVQALIGGTLRVVKTTTVTAGTPLHFSEPLHAPRSRVDILNGATGPGSLDVTAKIIVQD